MNIDNLLVDLEIVGQIKDNDKLAVSNVVGSTKLFVNQYSYLNSVYRRYNGYNRIDSIEYLENLITRVESSSTKIIDGNFTDMACSLIKSIQKALTGISNLKVTYYNDSEIVARLTICTNKITKVFENLKEYSDTMNDVGEVFHDINIQNENNNKISENTILDRKNSNT